MGTKTWDGGATGNWNVSSNWSPAGVPVTGDDVVINTAGCTVTLDEHIGGGQTNTGLGSLTITTGKLYTNDGSNRMLTVTGATSIASGGTLDCTGSDIFLGVALYATTPSLDVDGTGIFIGGTGPHNIGNFQMKTNAVVTLTSGVTTLSTRNTNSYGMFYRNGGTFNHGSGKLVFNETTSSDNRILLRNATTFNEVEVNVGSGKSLSMYTFGDGGYLVTVADDLTITSGTFNTTNAEDATDSDLTVAGEVNVAGTLTCNSSACSFGSLNSTGLTNLADDSGSTLITNENSDGLSIVAGTYSNCVPAKIKHNNGTVTFNNHSDPAAHAAIVIGVSTSTDGLYNVIIDGANTIVDTYYPSGGSRHCTIYKDFTVTNGSFQVNGASNPFDVGGDVLVSAGKMFGDGSAPTGAMNFGSLTIASGAEFRATSGITTLSKESDTGGTDYMLYNNGTFTHNGGKVLFDDANMSSSGNVRNPSSFHDVELTMGSFALTSHHNMTCTGTFTVTTGIYSDGSNGFDITEGVSVANTATLNLSDNASQSKSLGSLDIQSGGTFKACRGTTSITSGNFNNSGTFTHNNGTFKFTHATNTQNMQSAGTAEPTFYILDNAQDASGGTVIIWKSITVIHTLSQTGGRYFQWKGDQGSITGTFGSSSIACTITEGNRCLATLAGAGPVKFYGANQLKPWVITSGGPNHACTEVHYKWGDYSAETFNTQHNITIDGDMKFGAFNVNAGDELDINGQRVHFGGALQNSGAIKSTGGGLIIADNNIRQSGSMEFLHDGDVNVIANGGDEHNWRLGAADGNGPWCRNLLVNGNVTTYTQIGHASGNVNYNVENVIVGNGTLTPADNTYLKDLTVATGGTFVGRSSGNKEIGLHGDFTTSGGLIGNTGIYNNGIYNAQFAASADQNPIYGSAHNFTVEGWFKFDSFGYHVLARSANTGSWMFLNNNTIFQFIFSSFDGTTVTLDAPTWTSMGIGTNEWVHIAGVCEGTSQKLYINGKLVSEATKGAGVGNGSGMVAIGSNPNSTAYVFDGHNHMLRMWREARTVTELRDNMFTTTPTDSNTKLTMNVNYVTGGSGGTITDAAGNGNGVMYKTGHTTTTDAAAWAGAGTFTMGTSTIDMTGTGEWAISDSVTDYYNVKVAASGKTTTIRSVGGSEKRPNINNLLTHGGGTLTDISNADIVFKGTGTHTAGADLSGLYITYWPSSTDLPGGSYQFLIVQGPSTLASTGDITCTGYFAMSTGDGFDIKNNTLTTPRSIHYANSTFNMDAGSLIFTSTQGLTGDYSGRTFTAGPGATITGVAGKSGFFSENNYEVVGKIENLDVTNEELKVTGQVINCTGDIHQYFPTIDHDQQLDADTADDRDVNLGRDLDKNTELINS